MDYSWGESSFHLLAFAHMIEDIEAGKINCVITKDPSLLRYWPAEVKRDGGAMLQRILILVTGRDLLRRESRRSIEKTEKRLEEFDNLFAKCMGIGCRIESRAQFLDVICKVLG